MYVYIFIYKYVYVADCTFPPLSRQVFVLHGCWVLRVLKEVGDLKVLTAHQPCDRNPRHTLNPAPSTLSPQPSTLNLTSSTLNPQPSTLDPAPSTLHHEP